MRRPGLTNGRRWVRAVRAFSSADSWLMYAMSSGRVSAEMPFTGSPFRKASIDARQRGDVLERACMLVPVANSSG